MSTDCGGNQDEFNNICMELGSVIEREHFNHVVIGGDFNTSFDRKTKNLTTLLDFMEQHTLCGGLFSTKADISFSFESKANGHKSLIDHFLLSENLFEKVITYNCLDDMSQTTCLFSCSSKLK